MFPSVAIKKTSLYRTQNLFDSGKPFGERLIQAIEYLGFRARNCNAIEACETLEKIVSEQTNYRLFQKYFPDEWKQSQTSLFNAGYYEKYTERVNEFFQLVSENMFPLLSGWNDDPEMEFENFCVFSLNVDLCCDDIDYEYLRVSYVMALLFFFRDEEIWEYLTTHYKIQAIDFPEIDERPSEKLWELDKTGKEGIYLNMFEMVDHSTGNPWLDTVNCRAGEQWYEWNEETLDFLTESYKDAQEILEKTCLLDDLIEANPKQVLIEMISLWNDGRVLEEENLSGGQ